MDTFTDSEYPEENHQAPAAPQAQAEPQEPDTHQTPQPEPAAPQAPQPDSGAYHGTGTGRKESPYANSPYVMGSTSSTNTSTSPRPSPRRSRKRRINPTNPCGVASSPPPWRSPWWRADA